jgi:hypothetical protein
MRLDQVARIIVNADHGIMSAAEKLCVADCIWLAVPQANRSANVSLTRSPMNTIFILM